MGGLGTSTMLSSMKGGQDLGPVVRSPIGLIPDQVNNFPGISLPNMRWIIFRNARDVNVSRRTKGPVWLSFEFPYFACAWFEVENFSDLRFTWSVFEQPGRGTGSFGGKVRTASKARSSVFVNSYGKAALYRIFQWVSQTQQPGYIAV